MQIMNNANLDLTHMDQQNPIDIENRSTALNEEELKKQEFIQKLALEGKRLVSFSNPSESSNTLLHNALSELDELRNYVLHEQNNIQEKNTTIISKVNTLKEHQFFPATADVSGLFQKTCDDYARLIKRALIEIDIRKDHCLKYLDNSTRYILAPLNTQGQVFDDRLVEHHLANEVRNIRAFIKQERKDLMVLFSRYEHGFTIHMNHLIQLDFKLQSIKHAH